MKKIDLTKLAIGFFAISLSWIIACWIYYISFDMFNPRIVLYLFPIAGYISGISWVILQFLVLNWLQPTTRFLKWYTLPFVTAIYGSLALYLYGVMIDEIFDSIMQVPVAFMTGFMFGLIYSILIRSGKLAGLLTKRPKLKLISILAPALLLAVIFWVLPSVMPRTLYRYMPYDMQDKIFLKTLSQFKVGDDFRDLQKALPGEFDNFLDAVGDGGLTSGGGLYDYELQVKNYKITKLEILPPNTLHQVDTP